MSKKHIPAVLGFLILILLTLTACERPVPREEPIETPAVEGVEPQNQPELLPNQPVATQGGDIAPIATLDPNLPTPISPQATEAPAVETVHIVQPGDTLGSIALEYGVSVEEIAIYNDLTDINILEVDQELKIPAPGTVDLSAPTVEPTVDNVAPDATTEAPVTEPTASAGGTHIVQNGENLYRIGLKYGCTVDQMATHNGIVNPAQINVGQVLEIPDCN